LDQNEYIICFINWLFKNSNKQVIAIAIVYFSGTFDFLGLNFYTSSVITSDIKTDSQGSYDDDKDIRGTGTQDWIGYVQFSLFYQFFDFI